MTTNLNRSSSKTRDRHSDEPTRRSSRPSPLDSDGDHGKSADEVRETVKEAVGKGVSAVAGAVEGVAETMEETQLAETAEAAVHQVGGTVIKVVKATKEEAENLKGALEGEGGTESEPEDDAQAERDDPTFGDTESNTSGSPLTYGSGDDQGPSTYSPPDEDEEDEESKGI